MEQHYTLRVAGLTRELKRYPVSDTLDIAAFILFGDVEMTVACARELLNKAPEFDVIFTPEAKSIPLAYEMSRQSGKPYVVARKGVKVYMGNPIEVSVRSITTQKTQSLYVGEEDAAMLRGKRALVVDDVISTGESLAAIKELALRSGAELAGCCAVLAEGEAQNRQDIFYLAPLPLFSK